MFRPRPSCTYFIYLQLLCSLSDLEAMFLLTYRLCLLFPSLSDFSCRCPFLCSTSPPPLNCCLSILPLPHSVFLVLSRFFHGDAHLRERFYFLPPLHLCPPFFFHMNIWAKSYTIIFPDAKVVCRCMVRYALQKATLDRNLPFSVVPKKTSISAILFACHPPSYLVGHRKN